MTDESKAKKNGLIGFTGMNAAQIEKTDGFISAEDYHIDSLNENAVVMLAKGDGIGPVAWQPQNYETTQTVIAVFTHDGVEYLYTADTTYDGMKKFLETLH